MGAEMNPIEHLLDRRRFAAMSAFGSHAGLNRLFASEQNTGPGDELAGAGGAGQTDDSPPFNLPFQTMGGMQFWTDLAIDHGWRIQQNAFTDHCRMLDPHDVRQAWGTKTQVFNALVKSRRDAPIRPYSGKVLLVLHGLMRSRWSMEPLCNFAAQRGQYEILNMGYASSRDAMVGHGRAMRSVLKHIRGNVRIDVAAHSMGNLVVRRYWRECMDRNEPADPRIGRIVMLAPPNQGARLASLFRDNQVFKTVWGVSGSQIANWDQLKKQLATPNRPFGILAGGGATLQNPLLEGEDDWVVTVDETKLAGASDFHVMQTNHSGIMSNTNSLECMLRFFRSGYFVAAHKRRPLTEQDIVDG
jgi:hypothetical protein